MSDVATLDRAWPPVALLVRGETITLRTTRRQQFVDITELVAERVRGSGVAEGMANVQVLHTTVGLLVNEAEPLLLDDIERTLEQVAPGGGSYLHDDFARRLPPPPPDERRNGHAHCRAALLRASETLNVAGGRLQLGRWQRILLLELDGPQPRSISITVLGAAFRR